MPGNFVKKKIHPADITLILERNTMAEQRIQKVLSDQGVCSRRAAEKLIDEGRVKVNGHPVTLGDKMDPDFDKVSIDGKSVRIVRKRQYTYLMLNKPRGYITTASDERGRKTVMDLLTGVDRRVYPIGRLDKDSEGLLLLTDDGAFANLLTHPSGGVGKLYRVTVRPRATEEQVVKMSSGVVLDDGVKTQPAVIHVVVDEPGRTVLEITLHEGRNRQIRRMCEAVGLEVIRLKRSAEGPVKLGMLQPGEYRELKKSEISALRNAAFKAAPARKAAPAAPAPSSTTKQVCCQCAALLHPHAFGTTPSRSYVLIPERHSNTTFCS